MLNRILIVGGTGYLGRHLNNELIQDGYDVYISGTILKEQDKYFNLILEDENTFQSLIEYQFDLIIILASKINSLSTKSLTHPDLKNNTLDYGAFLEFISMHKITERIVYTSSMTVYDSENTLPVTENAKIGPTSTYGLSKRMAEDMTSFYCKNGNIKGVILRLPGIYGGDRKSGYIYNNIIKCLNNENIELKSEGLLFWETINVDNLAKYISAFLRSYDWAATFDIFNVSYGEEIDFNSIPAIVKSVTNSSSEIKEIGQKGYVPFYLSNDKIKLWVKIEDTFRKQLISYVNQIIK